MDGAARPSGQARGGRGQDVAPRSQITLQPWGVCCTCMLRDPDFHRAQRVFSPAWTSRLWLGVRKDLAEMRTIRRQTQSGALPAAQHKSLC